MEPSQPNEVIVCSSAAEVSEVVTDAIADGVPLVDYGLAHGGLGHRPPVSHRKVRLSGTVRAQDEPEMSVRVDAGCTFGELGRALAEKGRFLPLDADDDLTIGELIAHNVHGPLRLAYGDLSDLLLGLGYIDGEGEHVRVEGPRVNRLSGYDLKRLMVGSLGELGIITEATLRTLAMPTGTLSFDISLESSETLDNFLPYWLTTIARPTWLMMGQEDHHFVMHGAYFGPTATCMSQLHSLETLIERQPGLHITGTGEDRVDRDRLRRTTRAQWRRSCPTVVKVVVPPATTGFLCATLCETPAQDPKRTIEALPAHGCVFVGGAFDPDDARRLEQQINHVIQPIGGFHVWHRRPTGAEDIPPVWPMPDDYPMLAKLKTVMDPHAIFNPGRYLPADVRTGSG